MINQISQNENTPNQFSYAIRELQIGKLMRKANITKSCGISAYEVFQFLLLLSAKVTNAFSRLTSPERVKVFVLDDSVIRQNRSKAVELLARVYDHVEHKYQKGFNLLSSAKKSSRYQEISDKTDHRTNGYKTRKESMLAKPDAAILLIQRALAAGIKSKVTDWISSQAAFIQALFGNICWES